jgi:pimeloyl-ACP methyl ester carboxylesterase
MPRPGPIRLAATALCAVLVLGGCSLLDGSDPDTSGAGGGSSSASDGGGPDGQAGADDSGPALTKAGPSAAKDLDTDPAEDQAYASYYDQDVDWGPCGSDVTDKAEEYGQDTSGLECGTVTVPKVWNAPDKGDVSLAVVRLAATGEKKGSLLTNPGGPGGSGVDFVAQSAAGIFTEDMRSAYDIVGFDPRGVARSDGIQCLDDEQTDAYLADTYDPGGEEGLKKAQDWMKKIADACEKHSGDLLPYMDTYSAARDMDVLRSAVDAKKLDYLGFSYGTYLGATYADLYPQRVGKMTLDGAIDPTLTADDMSKGQAKGFQEAFGSFVDYCMDQDQCPLRGPSTKEAEQQLQDILDSIDESPLPSDDEDRPLTGALAASALQTVLYNDANWDFGVLGLNLAANGNGSVLMQLADIGSDRNEDGTYNGNANYSIQAVNCLDRPGVEDLAWQKKTTEELLKKYPLAQLTSYNAAMCDLWPVGPEREPAPITAEGSAPIVVVGTTKDPATPYPWAQGLAKQLDNSRLLTFEGEGHTAYGRSGGCIEQAVDAYYLDDTVPQDGLRCGPAQDADGGAGDGSDQDTPDQNGPANDG